MSTRKVELAVTRGQSQAPSLSSAIAIELRELELQIDRNRNRPIPALLTEVVDRISSFTCADGAAIAVRDRWGVVCRASMGVAPELGSRLQPDSALTRECFETGAVVVCEDTETDDRVRRATAKSLRLRSAVVVPIQPPRQPEGAVEVLGLIEVLSSRPFAFDAAQVDGLKRIAELLAPLLAAAQPIEPEVGTPVLIARPAHPEKPKAKRVAFLIAGAVLLFLLLFVPALIRRQPSRISSSPSSSRTSNSARLDQPASGQGGVRPDANPEPIEGQRVEPVPPPHSEAGASAPISSSSSTSSISSSEAIANGTSRKSSTAPPEAPLTAKNRAVENPAALTIRPAAPALVILGIPLDSQIFVDDHLVSSRNPSGQASVATLPAGQHRLRLKFNGYRDFEQGFDVQDAKTSTVTAKLERLELPSSRVELSKAPALALTPVIPSPVTLARPSLPDFVLDRTLKAHSGWVTGVAFSPDGRRLVSGSWDRTLRFWEVTTGEQLSNVTSKMKEVQSLAFSRDGRWLATENSSDTVTLRDPTTGREILALPSDKALGALGSNWVYSIAFSPDGRWLASGVDDKTVRLWDVQTGRKVRDLTGLRRPVIYIAFSPDSRLLATGDDSKTIRIWDASSGEQTYKLSGHKKGVNAVAFSPNAHLLASASADKTVKLWNLTTGQAIHTLTGHENSVTSLAFSPDGRWLVSGSWDKTIKIWDVETGRELQTLSGHDRPVYSVAFDARGRWLASGSEDGTIKLWRFAETADKSKLQP
jgi:WD40 repeat protein